MKTTLKIFADNQEIQFNTNTIGQVYLEEIIGTLDFFRSYRCVSDTQGINLLNMGIVTLRKTLMSFIEGIFTNIRTRLLAQKVERERYSTDKKLYKHCLSEKRLIILNVALDIIKKEYLKFEKDKNTQQGIINQIKSEIFSREKIIYYKQQEAKKLNGGVCPILGSKCPVISGHLEKVDIIKNKEIDTIKEEIKTYKQQLESEEESIEYYNDTLSILRNKENKAREKLLRLKGAFQFKDYKYTKSDILIYDEAIKVLDSFAGEYIREWLSSLSIILNNLLNKLNIRVEFTGDKDFIRVFDNEQILKYDQLSTGQKCFLGTVFKLTILLQQNKTGVILLDDGLNNLDLINFKNLIDIAKTLPFQLIAVYQNSEEIEDTKHFKIIREKGVSKVD